ncbi:hypothetical protein BDV59DRAFT_205857 [Aspergillus ambiguus]|uniref:uncharacterized protein n=1 Tax=Aspergillus ambiguus TaxID=176160 RepID=UPI003CCD8AD0
MRFLFIMTLLASMATVTLTCTDDSKVWDVSGYDEEWCQHLIYTVGDSTDDSGCQNFGADKPMMAVGATVPKDMIFEAYFNKNCEGHSASTIFDWSCFQYRPQLFPEAVTIGKLGTEEYSDKSGFKSWRMRTLKRES